MQITKFELCNRSTCYSGAATSTRGRRYTFVIAVDEPGDLGGVFRQDLRDPRFWEQVTAPLALRQAVRKRVRQ